jgi:hypothetical protein
MRQNVADLLKQSKLAKQPKQQDEALPEGFQNVIQVGSDMIGIGIGPDFGTGAFEVLNIRKVFIPKGEERFQPTSKGIAIPAASPLGKVMLKALQDAKLL